MKSHHVPLPIKDHLEIWLFTLYFASSDPILEFKREDVSLPFDVSVSNGIEMAA